MCGFPLIGHGLQITWFTLLSVRWNKTCRATEQCKVLCFAHSAAGDLIDLANSYKVGPR